MATSLTWTLPGSCRPASRAAPITHAMPAADSRSLEDLDERELVDACRAGRPGAFDLIVERHRRAVYLLCYRFVGSHEDASDLSQDVFLRAFRGLRSFRGQSTLATWLYRIGVNVCLNRVGAKDTLRKLTEPIETQQFVDVRAELPSDLMLKNERSARVRAAIAQLPRKQRATLILRTSHEMSHQEIADVLGARSAR